MDVRKIRKIKSSHYDYLIQSIRIFFLTYLESIFHITYVYTIAEI